MNGSKEIVWILWEDPMKCLMERMEIDEQFSHLDEDDEFDDMAGFPMMMGQGQQMIPHRNDNMFHFEQETRIGHTNFVMISSMMKTIDSVDGVDHVELISKYRFKIIIAKMFDFSSIRVDIERLLCDKHQDLEYHSLSIYDTENLVLKSDHLSQVKERKQLLNQKYKYWVIYVTPNGNIDYKASNKISSKFVEGVEIFNSTMILVGGAIFISESSNE